MGEFKDLLDDARESVTLRAKNMKDLVSPDIVDAVANQNFKTMGDMTAYGLNSTLATMMGMITSLMTMPQSSSSEAASPPKVEEKSKEDIRAEREKELTSVGRRKIQL